MNTRRLFLTGVFALSLGLGVWTIAAVTFTTVHPADFNEGDVVSAADFNQRFNDIDANFASAASQINANESNISMNLAAVGANAPIFWRWSQTRFRFLATA